MKKTISILLLFLGISLFSQETPAQKELLKKINECVELLNTNPEKAFHQAKKIEKEAQKIDAKEAELRAINIKCAYYKRNNDFENLIVSSKYLAQKSQSYFNPVYQVVARTYLFEAYYFSELPDKALLELKQGMRLLNEISKKDSFSVKVRADLLISYSNYYSSKCDYKNRIKYIKLSGKEFEKLTEGEYKQMLLYRYYSNLAGVYSDINNLDSAKYYAELSLSNNKGNNRSDVQFSNFSVLGQVASKRREYEKAVYYFKEAEKLKGYKNHLNIEVLYDNIIESYKQLQQEDSIRFYEAKKDSLKLGIAENQNKTLHKLLNEKKDSKSDAYIYILVVFLIALVFMFIVARKNKILSQQEKASLQYLENIAEIQSGHYARLLEMLKGNDPSFKVYFSEVFPDFTQKLLEINPKITPSEIEICTLLKLNIPTKDIARYKFIESKTVQNKKHLIRKKLNIPSNVDIYQWFEGF